jgi:hypothetical protein
MTLPELGLRIPLQGVQLIEASRPRGRWVAPAITLLHRSSRISSIVKPPTS